MNARHPLSYITADPAVGATRLDDDRDADQQAYEAALAAAMDQAPLVMLAKFQALKQPGDWFKRNICVGGMYSPDEIASEAINYDDASRDAFAELMTSPVVQKFQQAVCEWFGRENAMAIFQDSAEERH